VCNISDIILQCLYWSMDSKETPSSTTSRSDQAKNEIEKQSKSQIDKNDRDSDGKTLDKKLTPSTSSQNEDLLNSEINAAHEKDEKEKPSNETNKNESLKAYDETKTTKKTKGTISEEKSVKKTTKESDRVKNHFKEDYISPIGESVVRLNDVIWKKIFAYLDPITIFRCTCGQYFLDATIMIKYSDS
jgi:DNA mismatch repair ATPase MutL